MPRLVVSHLGRDGISAIGTEGKLWWMRPISIGAWSSSEIFAMALPSGVRGIRRRPSWATYNQGGSSRTYGVGGFTSNILVDEHFRCLKQGIPAPVVVPSVAAAAGPGRTGDAIFYWRFVDTLGGRIGPLSAPSTTVAMANQSSLATSLPTTCPDSSVDAIQQLCSMDGALPRVEWTRQLGATSVTSDVATSALGEAAPDDFTEMPSGIMNAIGLNDVQIVAGNQQYPERAFLSSLGEPEHYEGVYVQTEGEAITGIFTHDKSVFLGSKKRIYVFTGFAGTDIQRDVAKPDIGLLGFHGIRNCHGKVIVPTTQGIYMYTGLWNFLMDDRQSEWAREYATYRAQYEAAGSLFDPIRNVYKFGPVPHSEFDAVYVYWVLDLEKLIPELEATDFRRPAWRNDVRARLDMTSTVWELPSSGLPEVVTGSNDGYLRKDNVAADLDDDADAYVKTLIIEPATLAPDQGGSLTDGNTWHKLWNYLVQPPLQDWAIEIRAGTENCRSAQDPVWEDATVGVVAEPDAEIESVVYSVLEGVAGTCLNMAIIAPSPLDDFRWRGWGGTYGLGVRRLGGLVAGPGG